MATTQRLVTILILFLLGCDQPPATVAQTAPAPTELTQPAVEPISPPATPDATGVASEITGKVVGIIDGHTIDILTADKSTIRIRLNGIDAPEMAQPFSKDAKRFLSEFIGGQVVRVVTHDQKRYGRTIGDVYFNSVEGADIPPGATLPDGNINRELFQNGLAWHYKKYSYDPNLTVDEIMAREQKLGLWSDERSIPPWEWRVLSKEERDKLR